MAGFVGGSALSALGAGMVERAERADAERNARRSQGKYGASKEETTPLNPNRNDYEDIENPLQMRPSGNSILGTRFSDGCLYLTFNLIGLAIMIFCAISATLQDNGVQFPWWYPWWPNHKS